MNEKAMFLHFFSHDTDNNLQEIQDKFSAALGIGAILVDTDGNPLTTQSEFTGFCSAIRDNSEGARRCHMCDAALGQKALEMGGRAVHYCHAGLLDIAAPIVVNGVHVATVLCGQVLTDINEEESKELFEQCVEELDLDREYMEELRKNVNVVALSKLNDATDLLQMFASYTASVGVTHMYESILNEVTLQMQEEQKARIDMERILRTSELKSLQAQINPHFLFNTLNTIARLAMFEKAPRTEETTIALAELLRYTLGKSGQMVSILEEVDYIRKYFKIQQMRFQDRIQVFFDIDEAIADTKVPVMILQPLIENALTHGLMDIGENGEIWICGSVDEDKICLSVSDNGIGMEEEKVKQIQDALKSEEDEEKVEGIGIKNVYKRLKFYYGENMTFDIQSRPRNGTKISFSILKDKAEEVA